MTALAAAIACNILMLLGFVILTLILAVFAIERLLARESWRNRLGQRPAAIGLTIVLLALMLFLAMSTALNPQSALGQFDIALAAELRQTLPRAVLHGFSILTRLGNFETLTAVGIIVALVLLIRRHWLALIVWIIATAGNGLLNNALKQVFARVRPLHDHGLVLEQSFSFPSGHASGSLVVYGMLVWLMPLRSLPTAVRLPVLLLATTMIVLIGFSRVLLHVHYFSDVIAGFASSTIWLTICILGAERARNRG